MKDKDDNIHNIALCSVMIAIAMICGYIEMMIPISIGIPGIKLGFANIVTVICIYLIGRWQALVISLIRIILISILFGNIFTLAFSLTGGLVSFISMIIISNICKLSMAGISIIGGIMHNIAQLVIAYILLDNDVIFYYMPILIIVGAICGLVMGILASIIYNRLDKALMKDKKYN